MDALALRKGFSVAGEEFTESLWMDGWMDATRAFTTVEIGNHDRGCARPRKSFPSGGNLRRASDGWMDVRGGVHSPP